MWEAKIPPNASYTWRSIMAAREVIKEGSRWIIGAGHSVRFWKDKWVTGLPGGRLLSSPPHDENANCTVAEWRDHNNAEWISEAMYECLAEDKITTIKQVRGAENDQPDILSWSHTRNGEFSVRSAYHFIMENRGGNVGTSNLEASRWLWKKIWRANVPRKVRNLVWRAANDGLPTMDKLARRGMEVDAICPRCGEGTETITHMLTQCKEVETIWKMSPIRLSFSEWPCAFKEWCDTFIRKCKVDRAWEVGMMFLWQIWNLRNKWVFKKSRTDPVIACARTLSYLGEYEAALIRDSDGERLTAAPSCSTWVPPPQGKVKVNTDAGIRTGKVGVGIVVRDSTGDVLMTAG